MKQKKVIFEGNAAKLSVLGKFAETGKLYLNKDLGVTTGSIKEFIETVVEYKISTLKEFREAAIVAKAIISTPKIEGLMEVSPLAVKNNIEFSHYRKPIIIRM